VLTDAVALPAPPPQQAPPPFIRPEPARPYAEWLPPDALAWCGFNKREKALRFNPET
jgi:hypothetical protein